MAQDGFDLTGFAGTLLRSGEPEYEEARTVFNGMIDRRPAIIARCASVDDVVAVVDLARENDLPLSVYGGGHGVTGSAVVDAGICIDLRPMNRIDVDPDPRVGARGARAGGGGERSTPPPRSTASPSPAAACRTPASAASPSAAAADGSSAS